MMTKPTMSLDDAKRVAAAAAERAAAKGWSVVIAVLDDGANLLYFERMDGAKLGSIRTAIEKARSSVLFARPTKALEDIIGGGRNAMLRLPEATPIQGGLPLLHNGHLVGGIGVSGVLSPQDEEVARGRGSALAPRPQPQAFRCGRSLVPTIQSSAVGTHGPSGSPPVRLAAK